jgi:subtilisin family serine protease
MHPLFLSLPLFALLLGAAASAQGHDQTAAGIPPARAGATRYLVQFTTRSFDLAGFRAAVRRRAPEREMRRLVAGLEAAVRRDQAPFAARLGRLGGRVTQQWWIINGCSIEIRAAQIEAVRSLPGVSRIELDRVRRPALAEATNVSHHASDQANKLKTKAGAFVTGKGVSVAVLDTGADAISGATARPHLAHYPGGDAKNNKNGGIRGSLLMAALKVRQVSATEDATGHGTGVTGCIGANKWNTLAGVDHGVAPGAGIVSINIANSAGLSLDSWMVSGWQLVAANRVKWNIGVGNNSYSGSPSLSNSLQRALDSTAVNADILICVSAGNLGANTRESQHAYNGLAVGAVEKTFLSKSSYSAVGPLNGSKRTYPDLAAVGSGIITMLRDKESGRAVGTGTSYSAPLVAGAAALIRQARPSLSAIEVKALLLNTTLFRSSNRNHYGIGFMKADAAVAAALNGEAVSGAVATNRRVADFEFKCATARTKTITIAWARTNTALSPPDLNLRIYDSSNKLVAADLNPQNSYEHVRFVTAAGASYRAEITWANAPVSGNPTEFAIAGVTDYGAPKLIRSTPSSVASFRPARVELRGDALATVTNLKVGGKTLPFTVMDDTTIRFTPPSLLPIGNVLIQVTNPVGVSNTITLRITGLAKPLLTGDTLVYRGAKTYRYDLYSDRSWRSLWMVSLSNRPSKLPGIFDLGIGNNFGELITLVFTNQGPSGAAALNFVFPTFIPSSTQIYLQAMSTDVASPTLPYPASNVLPVRIL